MTDNNRASIDYKELMRLRRYQERAATVSIVSSNMSTVFAISWLWALGLAPPQSRIPIVVLCGAGLALAVSSSSSELESIYRLQADKLQQAVPKSA